MDQRVGGQAVGPDDLSPDCGGHVFARRGVERVFEGRKKDPLEWEIGERVADRESEESGEGRPEFTGVERIDIGRGKHLGEGAKSAGGWRDRLGGGIATVGPGTPELSRGEKFQVVGATIW